MQEVVYKIFTKFLQPSITALWFGISVHAKNRKGTGLLFKIIYKYSSGYQTLLKLSGKLKLRTLALEVFKTINGFNLNLMKKRRMLEQGLIF